MLKMQDSGFWFQRVHAVKHATSQLRHNHITFGRVLGFVTLRVMTASDITLTCFCASQPETQHPGDFKGRFEPITVHVL